MNKTILTLGVAVLFALGSCGGGDHSHDESGNHDAETVEETHEHADSEEAHEHPDGEEASMNEVEEQAVAAVYKCPMKCEGDKTYDKEGKCPKCGMALEKLTASAEDAHDHDHGDHEH